MARPPFAEEITCVARNPVNQRGKKAARVRLEGAESDEVKRRTSPLLQAQARNRSMELSSCRRVTFPEKTRTISEAQSTQPQRIILKP